MKWPKEQVAIIKTGFKQLIANSQHSPEAILKAYKTPLRAMYAMWRHVQYDLSYDNDHPAYTTTEVDGKPCKPRTRMCEYNADFVLYPPGCNDSHFKTVLKHIAKELFN